MFLVLSLEKNKAQDISFPPMLRMIQHVWGLTQLRLKKTQKCYKNELSLFVALGVPSFIGLKCFPKSRAFLFVSMFTLQPVDYHMLRTT